MIKGRKVYDPLTDTWSTGWWIMDDRGNYYPVWQKEKLNFTTQKGRIKNGRLSYCFISCIRCNVLSLLLY